MNFQVPQFIEVEDKLIGPLSFRQFLYLAGGAGLAYLFYNLTFIPIAIRAIPVMASIGLGLALSFYKINNRPLIYTIESAFWYYSHSRLYLWKKNELKKAEEKKAEISTQKTPDMAKLSESKLKDLSWSLDVNEKIK